MTQSSINILLGTAISRFQRTQDEKEPKQSSPAVEFDKSLITKAVQSDKERPIILSVAAATALQESIKAQTPAFVNKITATQPFDEIREQFLLPNGTLDNEKLLKASKELPSKEAEQLLLLGVENAHLEIKLLDYDTKGKIDTPPCSKVVRRLEQIEEEIKRIAATLNPETLLLK